MRKKSVVTNHEILQAIGTLNTKFDSLDKRTFTLEQGQDKVLESIKDFAQSVDNRFESIDNRFDQVEDRLTNLELGQDRIFLRLDNVSYRFEVKDLDRRVGLLESR